MRITKAEIRRMSSSGFSSVPNEGVTHVKVLPYLSVVQATEGNYSIALGGGRAEQTEEGGFFIAPAHVKQSIVHHVNRDSGRMSARWIFLDVVINATYRLEELYRVPAVVNGEASRRLHGLFERYFGTDSIWEKYSLCYQIAEEIVSLAEPIPLAEHGGIAKAVSYMTTNYQKPVTVAELSQAACMSKSNFFAAFKKQFGISPLSYLNHYRLSIAAEMLIGSSGTVKEIAYSVGIGDPLYFCKLFKNAYGTSPREYRMIHSAKKE